MTMRVLLACALLVAAGCGRKTSPPEDPAPGSAALQGSAAPQDGPPAPPPVAQRCRPAIDHMLATREIKFDDIRERFAKLLTESCQTDGWSAELVGCLERAKDDAGFAGCRPTADQQERLRTRLAAALEVKDSTMFNLVAKLEDVPESLIWSPLELRLRSYAALLAIDLSIFQVIEAYPGAPQGTTFQTGDYRWSRHQWIRLEAVPQAMAAILAPSSGTPSLPADAAVRAYAERLASWLPQLLALAAYYDGERYVDDEFDRGRREAADLRASAAALAKLRGPMRTAIVAAWRDLIADVRDSPRAIVTNAWLACTSVADRVMERAKPEAINKAVSECRRSIPKVTELPSAGNFDAGVRSAASELGDWVARDAPAYDTDVGDALGRFTLSFLALWPKLPKTPAEKPGAPK